MKLTVTRQTFKEAFHNMGRSDNFSDEGLDALFDYLTAYENATGEELELDPVSICCDFAEYSSIEDFKADYGLPAKSWQDVEEHTIVIPLSNDGAIIQRF